jgi:hypothetical protein
MEKCNKIEAKMKKQKQKMRQQHNVPRQYVPEEYYPEEYIDEEEMPYEEPGYAGLDRVAPEPQYTPRYNVRRRIDLRNF